MSDAIGRAILDDGTAPLTTTEARLLADRERARQEKAAQRARKKAEEQARADGPPPGGDVVPAMPSSLTAIRRWVQRAHDLYSARKITSAELAEIRRSASSIGDLFRVGADLRKADAAIRAAEAQERMADALAAVEHGGHAILLLQRLQSGLADGPRRPLPGVSRVLPMTPPGDRS